MKSRALFWLLLPVALVAVLFLAGVFGFALALLPPFVSLVSLSIIGLVLVWFFFARRATSDGSGSEYSFTRQRSKEGLL